MLPNASSECHNHSWGEVRLIPVSAYSFIVFLGSVLNLVALYFFCCIRISRSQTITYMSNLVVADVLLLATLPIRIYFHLGFGGLPQWLCDITGLILKSNMYGSIFLLTCICADRCAAVTYPLSARVQAARKKAWLYCLVVWVLTFGASVPIYLSGSGLPSESLCFDNLPRYATRPAVVVSTLLLGFGLPLAVMLVCSWALARAVRNSTAAQSQLMDSRKIQRMIVASLLTFLLSFLPYHVVLGALALRGAHVDAHAPCTLHAAYRYCLIVACLNTVLDPLVYYFTTETFRSRMDFGAFQNIFPLNSHSSQQANSRS